MEQIVVNEHGKQVLKALFCKRDPKPSLNDYTTIKTYEDALEALGEKAPDFEVLKKADVPKHLVALMKLETISRALWGKGWQPKPDARGAEMYYSPWFALCTEDEIKEREEEYKKDGALLSGHARYGAGAGFGYLHADIRSSCARAYLGFRLCQENECKAKYFGRQFIKLWAEYLAFNFTVGDDYFKD